MKRYAVRRADGGVSILSLVDGVDVETEIRKTTFPSEVVSYREISESALPASKNWRNAWTDDFDTQTIDIDLERAKKAHIDNMYKVAMTKKGVVGVVTVDKEIMELDFDAVKSLSDLYVLWPASIETRKSDVDTKQELRAKL